MAKRLKPVHKVALHNLPLAPDNVRVSVMENAKGFVVGTGNYASYSSVAIAAVAELLAYQQGYRLR